MAFFAGEYALDTDGDVSPSVKARLRKLLGQLQSDPNAQPVSSLRHTLDDGTVVIAQRIGSLYRGVVRVPKVKQLAPCHCFGNTMSVPTPITDAFTPFYTRLDDPAVYGHTRPTMLGALFAVFEDKIYFFANLTQVDTFGHLQGDGRGFVYDPDTQEFTQLVGVYPTYSSQDYGVRAVGYGYRNAEGLVRFVFESQTVSGTRMFYEYALGGGINTAYRPDTTAIASQVAIDYGPVITSFAPVNNANPGVWDQATFVCAEGANYFATYDFIKRAWTAQQPAPSTLVDYGGCGFFIDDAYLIGPENGSSVAQPYMTRLNMTTGESKQIDLPFAQFAWYGRTCQVCCCVLSAGGTVDVGAGTNSITAWSINLLSGDSKNLGDLPYDGSLPGATTTDDFYSVAFPTTKGIVVISEQYGTVSTPDGPRACIIAANVNVVT